MMESEEEFYEEEEVAAENVDGEVVLGEASPQPINIPLEVQVQVGPAAEAPNSPSLAVPPVTPSPIVPSPSQVSPVGDALSLMDLYSEDDVLNLE